jgi:hypothetical protein
MKLKVAMDRYMPRKWKLIQYKIPVDYFVAYDLKWLNSPIVLEL